MASSYGVLFKLRLLLAAVYPVTSTATLEVGQSSKDRLADVALGIRPLSITLRNCSSEAD